MTDRPIEMIKVVVDAEVCIGGGQCEMLEAEVFLVDEDTSIAAVLGDAMLPSDRAETVIDRCPSGAISIVPEATPASESDSDGAAPA